MKITVGTSAANQRTWYIPKTLLEQQSGWVRSACTGASTPDPHITFDFIEPAMFQNFVDFMHSNIYSLNKLAASYHPVRHNAMAWVLGERLEAFTFRDAALRTLYAVLEPLARVHGSCAAMSPISAADIKYVCDNTSLDSPLRRMLFDAVAAHWTQMEILNIGCDTSFNATTWLDAYNQYADFRSRLANSLKLGDMFRCDMLRPLEDYIAGRLDMRENEIEVADGDPFGVRGRSRFRVQTPLTRTPERRSEEASGNSSTEAVVDEDEYMTEDEVGARWY